MQEKDYLNQRYLRKRALYLAYIAEWIKRESKEYQVQFGYFQNDLFKPVIYVRPTGKIILVLYKKVVRRCTDIYELKCL